MIRRNIEPILLGFGSMMAVLAVAPPNKPAGHDMDVLGIALGVGVAVALATAIVTKR